MNWLLKQMAWPVDLKGMSARYVALFTSALVVFIGLSLFSYFLHEIVGKGGTLVLSLETLLVVVLVLTSLGIAAGAAWLFLAPAFTDFDIRLTGWVVLGLTSVTNVICLPQLALAIFQTLFPLLPVFGGMKLVLLWSYMSARRNSGPEKAEIQQEVGA